MSVHTQTFWLTRMIASEASQHDHAPFTALQPIQGSLLLSAPPPVLDGLSIAHLAVILITYSWLEVKNRRGKSSSGFCTHTLLHCHALPTFRAAEPFCCFLSCMIKCSQPNWSKWHYFYNQITKCCLFGLCSVSVSIFLHTDSKPRCALWQRRH